MSCGVNIREWNPWLFSILQGLPQSTREKKCKGLAKSILAQIVNKVYDMLLTPSAPVSSWWFSAMKTLIIC